MINASFSYLSSLLSRFYRTDLTNSGQTIHIVLLSLCFLSLFYPEFPSLTPQNPFRTVHCFFWSFLPIFFGLPPLPVCMYDILMGVFFLVSLLLSNCVVTSLFSILSFDRADKCLRRNYLCDVHGSVPIRYSLELNYKTSERMQYAITPPWDLILPATVLDNNRFFCILSTDWKSCN